MCERRCGTCCATANAELAAGRISAEPAALRRQPRHALRRPVVRAFRARRDRCREHGADRERLRRGLCGALRRRDHRSHRDRQLSPGRLGLSDKPRLPAIERAGRSLEAAGAARAQSCSTARAPSCRYSIAIACRPARPMKRPGAGRGGRLDHGRAARLERRARRRRLPRPAPELSHVVKHRSRSRWKS